LPFGRRLAHPDVVGVAKTSVESAKQAWSAEAESSNASM
jgi:hypothetical protein